VNAVWLRFRAESRTRWRAWLGLAVLVGLAAGAVMTLAAGARRTDSAYSRFLDAQKAYDVAIINYPEDGTAIFDFDKIAQLPAVADSARADYEYYTFDAGNLLGVDGQIGTDINRFKMLEGRRFDPERPDEMVVGFVLAEEHGLEVGDRVELLPREYIEYLQSPDTVEHPFPEETEGLTPEEIQAEIDAGRRLLEAAPHGKMRIVGIEASPGEFPPQFAVNRPLVHLNPALYPHLAGVDDLGRHEALLVRLHGGERAVDGFLDVLERRSRGRELQVIAQRDHAAAVERSLHFQAVALWLLAGLTALVALLIIGQLLARLTYLEAVEQPVLRALGMAPRERVGLSVLRALVIAVVGAVVGAAAALVASRFLPTGLARTAEPDPGFDVDPVALLLGVVLTVVVIIALSVWPAWRAGHAASSAAAGESADRASWLTRVLAGRRIPAPAGVGVRMALDPGRGRNAVPVRTTLAGVMLGIAAIVAALTFGASLARLLDTPRLYGVTWDFELVNFEEGERVDFGADGVEHLRDDDRVAAAAVGTINFGTGIEVDGERLDSIVLESVKGELAPPVLEGRAPTAADEIALGARTVEVLDASIGDVVDARLPGGDDGARMRIVGTAVFPTVSESAQLGEGAFITPAGAAAVELSDDDPYTGLVVKLAPGADGDAVIAELSEELDTEMFPYEGGAPGDIVNFGRVEGTPYILGAILGALSVGTLTHLLASAVRRRRRDLAMLKTLGFVRGQVRSTVAWQATTLVAVALLIGLPLGIAAGRTVWILFADDLGVVSAPRFPVLAVALMVPLAVLVANIVAAVPAWVAARTRPAFVLRSE
jgi:ABC-type lipoprotein release transport system permease subunit